MRLKRFSRPALALGLSLSIPLGAVACVDPTPHVVLGQAYTTGNPKYDDFFKAVRELHADAQRAEADERATRAPLIKALGLEEKAPAQLVVSEAGERARKLRDTGLLLHLEITPETKVVTKRESREANLLPATKDLIKAAEESTRSASALTARVGAIALRAAELEKVRVDLRAQAPSTFSNEVESKRYEITRELDASAQVLREAADISDRCAGLSAKFVVDLARALESGAGPDAGKLAKDPPRGAPPSSSPAAPAETHAAAKKPPPASGPAAPPSRPPAASKPPPAAGAKKPKGGDDFEP